jgi:hypothetical protein
LRIKRSAFASIKNKYWVQPAHYKASLQCG